MTHSVEQIHLEAGLYLVATPIGNLKDITLRALETLHSADVIYCEDTRQSAKLLQAYNIKTKTAAYHDHSKDSVREKICHQIQNEGKAIALISDAGMPLISDPGFKLVRFLKDQDVMITSVPGANAPLSAIQLSGLPSDQFTFLGFLPTKSSARQTELEKWKTHSATLVFYEAKQRVLKTLKDIQKIYGHRQVCIARELTKKFEEVMSGNASQLIDRIEKRSELKGEFVMLIAPYVPQDMSEEDLTRAIQQALSENISVKTLSEDLAKVSGWQKKEVYNLALTLKNS